MSDNRGVLIIGEGAVLKGDVKSGRRVEIWGYVEGGVTASEVVVQEGGKLFGKIKSDNAEIHGTLQGDVRVSAVDRDQEHGRRIGDDQIRPPVDGGGWRAHGSGAQHSALDRR